MKILMALTAHGTLGNTGGKTGFWLEEFAALYHVFRDAGVELMLASPEGGQPPIDLPESRHQQWHASSQTLQHRKTLRTL